MSAAATGLDSIARLVELYAGEPAEAIDFGFLTAAEHAAEVDAAPPPRYLARPVIAAGDYGMLAATKKAGKTWAASDLTVSVASGTPWLDLWPVETPGPVLVFLGEGGKRKMLRRLRAICAARGVAYETLPIMLAFRTPHLANGEHLEMVAAKVEQVRPVLIVIDPLYLAARGANASQLNEMGAHLEGIQHVAQRSGASLVVVHHWNKTGTGTGADRMSGAGPAEWGRFLVSIDVKTKRTEPDRSTVAVLSIEVEGDEVPDTVAVIRRTIRADNPDDLGSALHYTLEQVAAAELDDGDATGPAAAMSPAVQRVYAVLDTATDWLKVSDIGDRLADDGKPLKARTIKDACSQLRRAGLAEPYGSDATNEPWSWRLAGRTGPALVAVPDLPTEPTW